MTPRRLVALRDTMANLGLDGLLITNPPNRRYMSGFTGSAGALVVGSARHCVLADFRYWEQVRAESPNWELVKVQRALHIPAAIANVARDLGVRRLGFESTHLTYAEWYNLAEAADGITYQPRERLVERLRAVKDDSELALIRRAAHINDVVFGELRGWIHPGLTERQVAWWMEQRLREHGADGLAFPIIVASGPNAALPHARPTDRPLGRSESIVVDFGCEVQGYLSDMTRTFCLGPAPDLLKRVYAVVAEAHDKVMDELRAGMTGRQADTLARDVIAEYGYGERFGHSLGHSLGLIEHEDPGLSQQNDEPLPAGVVETVEPGVYLADWGGVRIEDLVIVHESGVELLSHADAILEWSDR